MVTIELIERVVCMYLHIHSRELFYKISYVEHRSDRILGRFICMYLAKYFNILNTPANITNRYHLSRSHYYSSVKVIEDRISVEKELKSIINDMTTTIERVAYHWSK